MPLVPGTRLGHYDVTALLGEGGMGQVWQATDTQLNRQVALKILPDAFADDPDRVARFTREAQILASLNHPNIATIHGLEEAEGSRALVLELVEGPTLANRIVTGPIPLNEALPIAKQIAEALEAAHEAGVIHRDLKPANIKMKYRPEFPGRFGSLEHARAVSRDLFAWYNDAHHHSGLSYLTPAAVHYGRAETVLTVRHRTRLAAYAAHPERFVQGPPRPDTLPTAVWINQPPKPTREDAPGATPVTPDDPQHGVIRRSPPITADRPITLVTSVGSLQ